MMETAIPARLKEEPSCASHNVIRTRRVNDNETFRLQEKLKVIDNRKEQKYLEIDVEKDALKRRIEKIKEVKKNAGISVERRRHLQSLGFSVLVTQRPSEEKEVKVLRRKSVANSTTSSAKISCQETPFASLLTRHSESSFELLSHFNNNIQLEDEAFEQRKAKENQEKSSFRETKLYHFRNIQPPIRSGSRRNFIQLPKERLKAEFEESELPVGFDPCSKLDHRGRIVLPPGMRSRRPSVQCAPLWHGRKMSVVSRSEDPDDTAKTPGSGKDFDWLKRDHDNESIKGFESASSAREPIQDQLGDIANKRPNIKSLEEQQIDTQEKSIDFDLKKHNFPITNADMNIDSSNSHFCHVTNTEKSYYEELSLENIPTTPKDLKQYNFQEDQENEKLKESKPCDYMKTMDKDSPKSVRQNAWSTTKPEINCEVFDPKETAVKPHFSGIRTEKLCRPASESEFMRKSSDKERQTFSGTTSDSSSQNEKIAKRLMRQTFSGTTSDSSSQNEKIAKRLMRQTFSGTTSDSSSQNEKIAKRLMHSSATSNVNSLNYRESAGRLRTTSRKQMNPDNLQHDSCPSHSNESHYTITKLAQVQNAKKIQLKTTGHHSVMIPSPPRTSPSPAHQWTVAQTQTSLCSMYSSRVQSAGHRKGTKEATVLAYDARPDKSLNKGYATMQITLRGKQVKVFVPRFPNEADDAMVERARARSLAKTGAIHWKDKI